MCRGVPVEVRGQIERVGSFLQIHGFWRSNSDIRHGNETLPAEPSRWPSCAHIWLTTFLASMLIKYVACGSPPPFLSFTMFLPDFTDRNNAGLVKNFGRIFSFSAFESSLKRFISLLIFKRI